MTNYDAVDAYLEDCLIPPDEALEAALQTQASAGIAPINVSPLQGKLLQIMALSIGAKRILEVGTLAGYSAIWMARALPLDGRLTTLELSLENAEVARANIARAGLSDRIEVIVGAALDSMIALEPPFDLVFIDANKDQNLEYFEQGLRLSRQGGMIIVDNVIRSGGVADANSSDARIQGVRRLMAALKGDARVTVTALQTVGAKGHDGFAIAVVN